MPLLLTEITTRLELLRRVKGTGKIRLIRKNGPRARAFKNCWVPGAYVTQNPN